jgi:hypothetical protein
MTVKKGKKNVSFNITLESIQKLKDIAEIDQRNKQNELEFLINNRWNELQVIELNRGMKPKGDN